MYSSTMNETDSADSGATLEMKRAVLRPSWCFNTIISFTSPTFLPFRRQASNGLGGSRTTTTYGFDLKVAYNIGHRCTDPTQVSLNPVFAQLHPPSGQTIASYPFTYIMSLLSTQMQLHQQNPPQYINHQSLESPPGHVESQGSNSNNLPWGAPFPSLHLWPIEDTFAMKMIHLPEAQRVSDCVRHC